MIYAGIDPGTKGGIALINNGKAFAMPYSDENLLTLISVIVKDSSYEDKVFRFKHKEHVIYCEDAKNAIHIQGLQKFYNPQHVYQQGLNVGYIMGMLYGFNLNLKMVFPRIWQKELGLIGGTKYDTAEFICSIYPKAHEMVFGPRGGLHDGLSDALAIAYYGMCIDK